MITLQKIGKLFILLFIVAGLASCKDDTENDNFDGNGEVIVLKRQLNDDAVYARAFYVYANQPMSSASVTLPEGETLTLSPIPQTNFYSHLPTIGDFTPSVPELGTFYFTVENEGIEHEFVESASFNDIDFATIDTVYANNNKVRIEWQLVAEADAYQVRLADENFEVLFTGDLLNNAQTIYEFWPVSQIPESGKTYKVEILAYSFEPDAGNSLLYNIEEISISSVDIVWP
ncbi:hypothetical protein [Maribellus mangrovi]|uniref:hypothetical protein n=1 Tax=Maribellus mangrovi TaxID=3133146 RepID=UPI0030EF0DEB